MINFCYTTIVILLFFACNPQKDSTQLLIKKLDYYPSASAIEYLNGRLYVMGDDATDLLVLDTNLNIVDSIPIISYPARRIPKPIKADFEASALSIADTGSNLYLFGSGSLPFHREFGLKYNFEIKSKDSFSLQPFYSQLKQTGIEQVNIEGACFVQGLLVLSNRGNKSYPHNHLVIAHDLLWNNDSSYKISIIPFAPQEDTASFSGISGLCYIDDQLIITVSTEDTRSSFEDGSIGKSYLWIINNISNKLNSKTIQPDRTIDLEKIDPRFKGQKIESATVISETNELIHLALVADNDDGSSTIFRVSIKKN